MRTSPSHTAKSPTAADGGSAEAVGALLHGAGVVLEDLAHVDARVATGDADVDRHLAQRQHLGVGTPGARGDEQAGLAAQRGRRAQHGQGGQGAESKCLHCSSSMRSPEAPFAARSRTRAMPSSVPTTSAPLAGRRAVIRWEGSASGRRSKRARSGESR